VSGLVDFLPICSARVVNQSFNGSQYTAVTRVVDSTFTPCDHTTNVTWTHIQTGPCPSGQAFVELFGDCAKPMPPKKDANGKVCKGNPCDIVSGNKSQREVDYAPSGAALSFVRTYNAMSYHPAKEGELGSPLGAGWFGDYLQYVSAPSGLSSATVSVVRPGGDVVSFTAGQPGSTSTPYLADGELKGGLVVATNGSGAFIGWRYLTGSDDAELYDANGRLLSITSRAGVTQTLTYGANSRVASVEDEFGHELTFQWDTATPPRLTTVTLPDAGEIEFTYGANNNLIQVTYPDTRTREYLYELTGAGQLNLLTGIEDEAGVRYATWGYGTGNVATSSEHAGGVDDYSMTYNSDGTRDVVDPHGTTHTYTTALIAGQRRYTGSDLPCEGCGEHASVTYDSAGNFESTTDFNGVETRYEHDVARTLETERTEAYGTARERTISTEWHADFRLPIEINEPGRRTEFDHDADGNVETLTVTDTATSQSRVWGFTYNAFGQVLTIDGPRTDVTDVTTLTYYSCSTGDECGQLETMTDAAGNLTTYEAYNAHGLPLEITDPNGTLIELTYDARQRLTSRTVDGEMTEFEYFPHGLLERITQPDGSFVEYGYDAAHRLTSVTDTAGNTITYTLNGAGQRLTETVRDAAGVLTFRKTRVYNSLGRLVEEHGNAGQLTSFDHDDEGNVIEIEDPLGHVSELMYDELNRLATFTDPAVELTVLEYDDLDHLIEVTDPRALVTGYGVNAFGEQVSQTSPDTGASSAPRDAAGNLDTATDARNETGDYTHDALNRVTEIEYGDETVGFGYDEGINGNGRLTSMTDGSGSTAWSYDPVGRVTERSQTTGTVTLDVGYAFDADGRLDTLTTPSGQAITYEYADGRLAGIRVNGSYVLNQIAYQPFGPTEGWTWGNGTATSRTFDTDGQLTSISSAGSSTYSFYADGTIATKIDDFATSPPTSAGTTSYTTSTTSNRLQSTSGLLSRTYGYDAAGNATSDGSRTFTHSDRGRMRTATSASVTTTYSHNGLGERVRKTNSGATVHFAYDEAGHLLGEYNATGGLIQETVWFGDIPVATLKPNGGSGITVLYIHTDHLNTPRRITRPADNAIVWRWDSHPFGDTAANQDPDGDTVAFAYHLRFPGQYFDTETGLHYNYFRDYDAVTGRYIQSDPIGLEGGLNPYLYADADPLLYSDPLGLKIVVVGNRADYNAAIAYINRDPGMARIVRKLESSRKTYMVLFNNAHDDRYDPATRIIHWDPGSALACTTGGTQTPAMGLGHEMAHAAANWFQRLRGWIPSRDYDYLEERRVIRHVETPAAQLLGEGTRQDHGGGTYRVPTPTSR
jgi:RHS repeat-associated protein